MLALFAVHSVLVGWSFADIAKAVIIIAAIVGVVFVITKAMGVTIPGWVITVAWIVVAAFVGILAIGLLASM